MKRKIYSAEAPTPQPCCPTEEKLWNQAYDIRNQNYWRIVQNKKAWEIVKAESLWLDKSLKAHEGARNQAVADFLTKSSRHRFLDREFRDYQQYAKTYNYTVLEVFIRLDIVAAVAHLKGLRDKAKAEMDTAETYVSRLDKDVYRLRAEIEKRRVQILQFSALDEAYTLLIEKLEKNLVAAKDVYYACLKANDCPPIKPLPRLSLNLNSSCKEIKQKIKTLNQKTISSNRKLLDLKYGFNSLHILNINKKLYDSKIKSTTDVLEKFDKIRSDFYSDFYLEPTKTFLALYNQAKTNLALYKKEINTIDAEIKISKEKIKKIPENKIKLKDKISKLFEEFEICLLNIYQG